MIENVMASDMPNFVINHVFSIWLDCYCSHSLSFSYVNKLRCINKMINSRFKLFDTCDKIYKKLRFCIMYDKFDHRAGSIYGVYSYVNPVSRDVKNYIDFCKNIINDRPIRMTYSIINVIKSAWILDIIPFEKYINEEDSFYEPVKLLSGNEKFDFNKINAPDITNQLAFEITEYILLFRNRGVLYNKNRSQLELERNEIAVDHNNRISIWKKYMRPGNRSYNVYKKWIDDEHDKKQTDWDYRSESLRQGAFVTMTEYYFRAHQIFV